MRRSDTITCSVTTLLGNETNLLQCTVQFLGTDRRARSEGNNGRVVSGTLNKQKRPIGWGAVELNGCIVNKGVVNQSCALSNVTRDNLWVSRIGSRSSILLELKNSVDVNIYICFRNVFKWNGELGCVPVRRRKFVL